MPEVKVNKENIPQKEKLNFFDKLFEIVGWVQIVASPLLLCAIIGFLIYVSKPNTTRLIIAIAIVVVGLIVGIVWATTIWKGKGTINFISRVNASPELDPPEEKTK